MRYTIGCKMIDKKTGESYEGYYAYGAFGIASILVFDELAKTIENAKEKSYTYMLPIFDNKEDVDTFVGILARSYRRDDVWANDSLKSKKIRKFFPLKVDSSNFKLELTEEKKEKHLDYHDKFKQKTTRPIRYQEVVIKDAKR